jgi:hypothetical protein
MDWNDLPARSPAQPATDSPPPAMDPKPAPGGVRRRIATAALAVGLLVVGGTAVVLAADPSASPAPSAATQPSDGSGGTTQPSDDGSGTPGSRTHKGGSAGDCPDKDGSGSGGSTAPSTAPDGSTSSPDATNL